MANKANHIVDRFGRIHNYLRISLTERCNLRCFYCMPEEGVPLREKSSFMTHEEILTIAKTFVDMGVSKIRLTGGEPLIKKNIEHLLLELGKLPVELAITTNAVLVDKYLQTLKKAGIRSVNVSLDSLDETRFNSMSRRNYFNRILNNINLLIKHNFNVKVNVVVIKGFNDKEIIDFIEWSKRENIHVRFIEFMPFNGNNWNWEKKVSYEEILQVVAKNYGENNVVKLTDKKNDTTRSFQIREAKGSFGIISSVTNPFCDSCNRIRLTADGKLKNCLFSEAETDLLTALRKHKNIEELIRLSIYDKKKERGGAKVLNDDFAKKMNNRSMITIGG